MNTQESEAAKFFDDLDNVSKPLAVTNEPAKEKDQEKPLDAKALVPVLTDDGEDPFKAGFHRDKKKKGATPEESIAVLRRQRDEEREKNKRLSSVFGESDPDSVRPIFDLMIERANGPITKEFIQSFLDEYKGSETKLSTLAQQLEEKEKQVSELDIRYSDDFKNNFEKPYGDAMESLYLEFANIEGDKVLAPIATKEFNEFLTSKPDLDGIAVKAAIVKFAKEFRAETGEEPILPSVTDLMKSLREFGSKRQNLQDAYLNWKEKKKELEENRLKESEETNTVKAKAMRRKRVELASKAFQGFEFPDFIQEEDVSKLFNDEFTFTEGVIEGIDVPEYDKVLQRGVKARLWDMHQDELVELRQFKASHEKKDRNGFYKSEKAPTAGAGNRKFGSDHYLD